jgi:transcriptional regulator with XRE-family HTH domain
MITFTLDIGLLIGVRRMQQGWSQKELAARLGCSPQYVNDIESGRRPVRKMEMIQRLADTLSMNPDPLYYAAGLLPPDIKGDYSAEKIRAAFDAMREVLR